MDKKVIQSKVQELQHDLREFILPYDEVRNAKSPADTLLDFLQTTYEAAADLANWDRASLEGLKYL